MPRFVPAILLFRMLIATVQGANECCPEIQNLLEDVKFKIEDLREKLGEQFEWPPSHDGKCPLGFTHLPSTGSCYKVIYETHDWYSADKICRAFGHGSNLAAITSATENNALKAFLSSESSKNVGNTVCTLRNWGNLYWTSGQQSIKNDCSSPYVWGTSSGRKLPFGFSNWGKGEPNCGSEELCVHIWSARDFTWNNHPCAVKMCPLCEFTP